jgi:hypothetical protein
MIDQRPDQAVARLLDALEADILAASDDEVRDAAAAAARRMAYAMRDLLRTAIADRDRLPHACPSAAAGSGRDGPSACIRRSE